MEEKKLFKENEIKQFLKNNGIDDDYEVQTTYGGYALWKLFQTIQKPIEATIGEKLSPETIDVLKSLKQDLKSSKSFSSDSMAEVFNNAMDLAVTFVDEHLQGHCNIIKEYETVSYVLRIKDIQIDDNGLKNINNLIASRHFWAEQFMKVDLIEKVKCYASMMYCDIQLKSLLNIQDYE